VDPLSSPTEGGQQVDIFGARFNPGVKVEFGGFPALITYSSEGWLKVLTPPHRPGPVDIVITNPDGLSCTYVPDFWWGPFTYSGNAPGAPVVQQLDPPQGSLRGGETVTVRGQNLYACARVFFGVSECTNVVHVSSQALRVITPAGLLGPVDVRVLNADTQTSFLAAGFTYIAPLPVITGLSTNAGPTVGGTRVTLTGSGFMPGSQVLVAGNVALDPTFLGLTNLAFTTPPGFPGAAPVSVLNPGNRSGSLASAFTYRGSNAPPPDLVVMAPQSGEPAGGTPVVLTGYNFLSGASVTIGGRPLAQLQIRSLTSLAGLTPPGTVGFADVVVSNTDGQTVTWPGGFAYFSANAPPAIIAQPQSMTVPAGTNVILSVTALGSAAPGVSVAVERKPHHKRLRVGAGFDRCATRPGRQLQPGDHQHPRRGDQRGGGADRDGERAVQAAHGLAHGRPPACARGRRGSRAVCAATKHELGELVGGERSSGRRLARSRHALSLLARQPASVFPRGAAR
jgi:hypothetical protein